MGSTSPRISTATRGICRNTRSQLARDALLGLGRIAQFVSRCRERGRSEFVAAAVVVLQFTIAIAITSLLWRKRKPAFTSRGASGPLRPALRGSKERRGRFHCECY
jgi:hypothetical protein